MELFIELNDIVDYFLINFKLFGGILFDDVDVILIGYWIGLKNFKFYVGLGYIYDGVRVDGKFIVIFKFIVFEIGCYEVWMVYLVYLICVKKVFIKIKSGLYRVFFIVN